MIEFTLEGLKHNAQEAEITEIIKDEGDKIIEGEILFKVETEKATQDISANTNGIIKEIMVEVGDKVELGAPLARIKEEIMENEESDIKEEADESETYNLISKDEEKQLNTQITIIGAGPGGYVAAIQAAKMGADVVLIEKDKLGGTCLNRGCIPTKALVRSGEVFNEIKSSEKYGFEVKNVKLDMQKIMERKNNIVNRLRQGIKHLMQKNGIQVINGKGKVEDQNTVTVSNERHKYIINTENIIIATGSNPWKLPIPGNDLPGVLNSKDALELKELPEKIVIIGGGYIGLEFAFIFNNLGVEVTVAEYLNKCVASCDNEVCREITEIAEKKGINIYTRAEVTEIFESLNGEYVVKFNNQQKEKYITGDKVLMAVGRKPNFSGINPEKLNLGLDENDRGIKVNEKMQTSIPNIYAIGDVTDKYQLAHVASHQGILAVKNIMGKDKEIDYSAVPSAIFTDPEIATVGLQETEAKEQGIEVEVSKFPFNANGKVLVQGKEEGFLKIVKNRQTDAVVGAAILGVHASDLIAELTLAVNNELTAEQIAETIHTHPTLSEVVHEGALQLAGGALHYSE
ncbi:MAG: dihydrolipoyl dehydrogenase [Halanaerobiales bacterium]